MSTAQQREELKKVYSSLKWTKRVNAMSDAQVVAVYLRMKKEGQIR